MAAALPSTSSSSSHPFPPPPPHHHPSASSSSAPRNSRTILSDTISQSFGNPNSLPGPPPSHFFPSVPKAQRDRARQARLDAAAADAAAAAAGNPSPPPPAVPAKDGTTSRAGAGGGSSDDERQQRQARAELASSGPFDNRRPSVGTGVGAGGSAGTKRRFRDVERTSWDAASELVRFERERERAMHGVEGGKGKEVMRDEEDREKTPTPSMAQSVSFADRSQPRQTASTSVSPDPPEPAKRFSIASIVSDDADADGDEAMALDDDASVVTGATGTSANGEGGQSDGSATEPAKKRSRTLTTPAQTAVLNALLAKTRFPSTEVREEVGRQIGMSARRVQVWFQNRRQSQKRQRDREAQEAAAASAAAASAMSAGVHPSMHHPGYPPLHPHAYPPGAHGGPIPVYPGMQGGKPLPPHPGVVYPGRPDLHRIASIDSLGSQQSYASSRLSMGSSYQMPNAMYSRDSLAPLPSEQRFSNPYAGGAPRYTFGRPPHPAYGPTGLPVPPPQHAYPPHPGAPAPIPTKLYFPHVPRSHAPPGGIQADPLANTGAADVKLPSLSSVLGAGPAAPQPAQQPPPAALPPSSAPVDHQPMFSHSPFSSTPTHASVTSPVSASLPNPSLQRAMFSPEPSSSFERLRISNGPLSPTSVTTPTPFSPASTAPTPSTAATTPVAPARPGSTDILDVAMETMAYRSSGRSLPPRQTLPPLRSVFGDAPIATRGGKKGGPSEADKALLAPIKAESAGAPAAGGPPRLPPIQSFAPVAVGSPTTSSSTSSSASPPATTSHPPIRDSRASTWSEASHATRSSAASFEFGKPPAGSYRASTSSERDVLAEERARGESVETEETSASAAEVGMAK
ncbi:hypothetical protein JCM10296v2_005954 [Rhodotorula toruloides]